MSIKTFFLSHIRKSNVREYGRRLDDQIAIEIVWYIIFLITVNIVAFSGRSILAFYFTNSIERLFLQRSFPTTGEVEISYEDIVTIDDWWNFMEHPFVEGIYMYGSHNEKERAEIRHSNKTKPRTQRAPRLLRENVFLGPPRIRQLKVRDNTCKIHSAFQHYFQSCFARYSMFNEAHSSTEMNSTGYFTWGQLHYYRGGGYTKYLENDQASNEDLLNQMRDSGWIERGTRLVVVEFNLYNANTNLFCLVKFITEFPPIGGAVTSHSIRTFEMLVAGSAHEIFIIAMKVLFFMQLVLYTARKIQEIHADGRNSLRSFWQWIGTTILMMGYLIVIFDIIRYFCIVEIIHEFNAHPHQYVEMDGIAFWQYQVANITAICTFLVWIQIFKYISFNKTIHQFSRTLSRCAVDLFGFGVMFSIVFIAFAELGYLLFGTINYNFRTFVDSIFTMLRSILGDLEYLAIEQANRILGPIFFMTYIFFVLFILVNMFLAIINDTYSDVKSEDSDDIPMLGFFKKIFANFRKILCCGRDIYKTESPTDDQIELEPTRSSAVPETSTSHEPPLAPQERIVVRRRDLIGKIFQEIDPNEENTLQPGPEDSSGRMEPQSESVEERLRNLEMLMDSFVEGMNTLIDKLDNYESENDSRSV